MSEKMKSIEQVIDESATEMTANLLLSSSNSVIRNIINNCDSEIKAKLVEGITQLVGEGIYQGVALGFRLRRSASDNFELRKNVN